MPRTDGKRGKPGACCVEVAQSRVGYALLAFDPNSCARAVCMEALAADVWVWAEAAQRPESAKLDFGRRSQVQGSRRALLMLGLYSCHGVLGGGAQPSPTLQPLV
jgi:hypothetical protein